MAYSFPLTLAQFQDLLPLDGVTVDLPGALSYSETGGGHLLPARQGSRLWRGQIDLMSDGPDAIEPILALIDILREPAASFLVGSAVRQYPKADPDGSILGAATVTVGSKDANNREMTLSGAPAGYVISAGDHLSIAYGTSPVQYAYFRVVTGGTFTGAPTAVTGNIEVAPFIPGGVSAGAAVTLIKPRMKAILRSDEFTAPRYSGGAMLASGTRFSWLQTMR